MTQNLDKILDYRGISRIYKNLLTQAVIYDIVEKYYGTNPIPERILVAMGLPANMLTLLHRVDAFTIRCNYYSHSPRLQLHK